MKEEILEQNIEDTIKPAKSIIDIFIEWMQKQYDFRFNQITKRPEYKEKGKKEWIEMDDIILNNLEIRARMANFSKSIAGMIPSILKSEFIPHENDFLDYFKSVEKLSTIHTSGDTIITPTIEKYFKTIEINKDLTNIPEDIIYTLFQRFIFASVNSSLSIKHNDVMLILQGNQGLYKTTWLNNLLPPKLSRQKYLVSGHIEPSLTNGNTANYLCEKFFINIDDQLETIFGKDFNSMKAIISADQVTSRRVYSVYDRTRKRIANFLGSVNTHDFLIDSENRRYLVIPVAKIDENFNQIDMNKFWSEAYQAAKLISPNKVFTRNEYQLITELANGFVIGSNESYLLEKYFSPEKTDQYNVPIYMTTTEITFEFENISKQKLSFRKVGLELKRRKYKLISKRIERFNMEPRILFCLYTKKEYSSTFDKYVDDEYKNVSVF